MGTTEVLILSAARTPLGSLGGSLAMVPATRLGATAIQGALDRAGVAPDQVSEVIMGNVLGAGQGQAPARQAAIHAGIPASVPAFTVNKVCGSGMLAVLLGARSILLGEADLVVAGGMENMSLAPYLLPGARSGYRLWDQKVVDGMVFDGLWDPYSDSHMGHFGDKAARELGISRQELDEYAAESFRRALAAQEAGDFAREIVPVRIPGRKGETLVVSQDEGPAKVKFERIPTLKPVFGPDGTVTAANASTINDGAAALVLASAAKAEQLGLKPIARIVSWGQHSQEPSWFTTAPAPAMRRALERAGWALPEVDLFEVNEAFAVVALAAAKELQIPRDKLNVRGGAISLGHPHRRQRRPHPGHAPGRPRKGQSPQRTCRHLHRRWRRHRPVHRGSYLVPKAELLHRLHIRITVHISGGAGRPWPWAGGGPLRDMLSSE